MVCRVVTGVRVLGRQAIQWVLVRPDLWSTEPAHEALITQNDFDRVQEIHAAGARRPVDRKPHRSKHDYIFKGLIWHESCNRRMQGHWANNEPYYRCRYPNEYALANTIDHARNVY